LLREPLGLLPLMLLLPTVFLVLLLLRRRRQRRRLPFLAVAQEVHLLVFPFLPLLMAPELVFLALTVRNRTSQPARSDTPLGQWIMQVGCTSVRELLKDRDALLQ